MAMKRGFKMILGSQSMARKRILAEMGYEFTVVVVVYKGVIREKPTTKDEARLFIKGYSGSHGGVVGSVLVSNLKTGVQRIGWDKAEVYFHEIPEKVIDDLIDDAVTFKVAGGLMLEHPLIAPFIDTVVGGVDTVMGLPKELTEKFISEVL
ncbi:Maf-like protein [Hirschfeldia incana]|nr:Maf-like protein [Hirschfeldia incana]